MKNVTKQCLLKEVQKYCDVHKGIETEFSQSGNPLRGLFCVAFLIFKWYHSYHSRQVTLAYILCFYSDSLGRENTYVKNTSPHSEAGSLWCHVKVRELGESKIRLLIITAVTQSSSGALWKINEHGPLLIINYNEKWCNFAKVGKSDL